MSLKKKRSARSLAKSKLIDFIKNLSYTFVSNILSMIISAVLILVIPKLVGVESYGYYQLYLFYTNYVGVLYFGWCDGIYLRLGGKYYDGLDKPLYSTQFRLLGLMEIIIYVCIFLGSLMFINDVNKHFVIGAVCLAAVGMCLRWFITFILQPTARIKEYAIVTISEKILFVILAMFLMAVGYRDHKLILAADVLSKYVSLGIGIWYCRDIVFSKTVPIRTAIPEIKENMSAGIKLMLASLSSMLIIGVVRFGVENHWDIATFGKVSLTLSLSNMVMTAINAIAVVMYPMLRRTNEDSLPKIYGIMRVLLMGIIFGGIVLYYPAYKILSLWLPQYAASLRYAAILLPMCAYESKMSMLVNTYYKTLRLENLLMKCNMAALGLSVILTLVSTLVLNSVTAAIISILIVLIFRCVLSEIILSTKMPIKVIKDIVIELIMTVAFIICNWFFGVWGMLAYFICYLIYISLKRNDIKETLTFIKSMR